MGIRRGLPGWLGPPHETQSTNEKRIECGSTARPQNAPRRTERTSSRAFWCAMSSRLGRAVGLCQAGGVTPGWPCRRPPGLVGLLAPRTWRRVAAAPSSTPTPHRRGCNFLARALPHSWWVGPQARPPAGPTLVAPRRCHVHRGCRRDLQRWRPNPLVVVCARALQRRGRTTRDPAGTLLASDALGARGGGPRQRDQWKPSARRGRRWASPAGRQAGLALHQPGPHTPRGGVPWLPCLLDGRAADSRHAVVARELAVAAGQRETDFVGHFQLEPQSSPRGALLQRWVLRGCGRARNGTGWPATRRGDYLSWSRENRHY